MAGLASSNPTSHGAVAYRIFKSPISHRHAYRMEISGGFTLDCLRLAAENNKKQHTLVMRPFKATLPEFEFAILSR